MYKKSVFYKIVRILYPYKNALWALRPAKPLGVLSRHPCRNPKPLPRGEGLCMLGWLCVLQSLAAYTPDIRAGAILLGLPPQTKQGCLQSATQSHCTMQWHKWLTTCTGATPQSKDALVACQKFCTMQNQQSKQHSTSPFLSSIEVFRQSGIRCFQTADFLFTSLR